MLHPHDQLGSFIDHTVLKADTTREILTRFCEDALRWRFASVCVNPVNVAFVTTLLEGSDVRTCAVVGFPLGANRTEVKVLETTLAIADGATEIDMVIDIGALKDGRDEAVANDIAAVVRAAHPHAVVKVIIETSALDDDEKTRACRLAVDAEADFVKTSTGFGAGGATVHDVSLMARTVGNRAQVKASTGVSDFATFEAMLDAGATRVGTSKGIAIVQAAAERSA
ncbi:deoxyribose-phosphate aldolase [Actinotalea sp. K2]|uniref:deoxyribose-phosphate aldolase n=1 Tax=Actinotalea sp. K2 TaxID=2939438 RepID=UPI0020183AEF|nr:deoxyribose-phosphate aldolase [Actinotalea sp. K2]MCL3863308.1 deoxyribose-phosphate aldolase [Actinotalea sp. K2]